jgi:bacterioferritin
MADQRLLDILNESIANELAAIIQYMWQHVMVTGLESAEFMDILKNISIQEMKHAEKFAERLDYFGGVPTTKPSEIKVGGTAKQMLKYDIAAEKNAIALYKKGIKLCQEIDDPASRHIFEDILEQEEDHDYTFSTLLG